MVNHLNCCQKMLMKLRDITGISEFEAENLGSAFGGGACCGELCGAVSGSLMALGIVFNESEHPVRPIAKEFQEKFVQEHGNIRCSDLLGYDMNSLEGCKKCADSGVKSERCPTYIKSSEQIVRELYHKYQK